MVNLKASKNQYQEILTQVLIRFQGENENDRTSTHYLTKQEPRYMGERNRVDATTRQISQQSLKQSLEKKILTRLNSIKNQAKSPLQMKENKYLQAHR